MRRLCHEVTGRNQAKEGEEGEEEGKVQVAKSEEKGERRDEPKVPLQRGNSQTKTIRFDARLSLERARHELQRKNEPKVPLSAPLPLWWRPRPVRSAGGTAYPTGRVLSVKWDIYPEWLLEEVPLQESGDA